MLTFLQVMYYYLTMAMFSILRSGISANYLRKSLSVFSVQYFKTITNPQVFRQFADMPRKGRTLLGEVKYIQKDKIPPGFQLIYRAPMQTYVSAAHHFTNLSALAVATLALYVTVYGTDELEAPLHMETALKTDKSDFKYYAVAFILLCIGMRHIVMRYPHRIFRKDKECIAVLEGQVPFTKRQFHFRQGQVTQMEPKGFLPWKDSWYKANNQKMILLIDYFKTPSELHNMIKP